MNVGFYGKLPSHGDFLRRRASDAFVDAWDAWLRECLSASRSALGDRWLDVYLTSPVWRFVCAPGAAGPTAILGLMGPSIDRVGRYFPLTLVSELPADVAVLVAATESAAFFASAERLIVDTLAADEVDFNRFDQELVRLGDELQPVGRAPRVVLDSTAAAVLDGEGEGWQIPLGSSEQLPAVFGEMLSRRLSAVYEPLVVWWTQGSSIVEPGCLLTRGLPDPQKFAALLDGSWVERQWLVLPAQVETPATMSDTLIEKPVLLRFQSAAATDIGRARGNNEDAFVERPEVGLWAVADGLGGHSDGEVASRMVCDALVDLQADGTLEELVAAVRIRIQQVNDHLLRTAARSLLTGCSGSTIALLLTRGARSAILWAGDSRVYRWRGGSLEQLSRDHNPAAPDGSIGADVDATHVVTRAVGVQAALNLDVRRDSVCEADRFLLCSDGLTRVVSEDQIGFWLKEPDIRVAVDGLILATLDAGAPDNVTVLIVEAHVDAAE